ncbi:hypothetical protein BpHYR1_049498 [Brachionus plicatilis]|uniref:Uncharacterized protein n=1 Tax=Brachionus plicatilis TaxID=10195 RepID=A0A3M7S8L1_BRAPC|nr:hypothetical protein BpHYR1_049498 [Brachionus plicatilis]
MYYDWGEHHTFIFLTYLDLEKVDKRVYGSTNSCDLRYSPGFRRIYPLKLVFEWHRRRLCFSSSNVFKLKLHAQNEAWQKLCRVLIVNPYSDI